MTIGVLRGGPSSHYELSLASGAHVIRGLRDKYSTRDIFIDREGVWHYEGMPTSTNRLLSHIDLFWNALHGEYGEDGTLQRDLDSLGASYTGTGATSARFVWRKDLTKLFLKETDILVPDSISVRLGDDLAAVSREAFACIGGQYVVKPVAEANSRGVFFVPSYGELEQVLRVALEYFGHILVEEAIHGKELKCLVARGFRARDYYAFLPIEIDKGVSIGIYNPDDENTKVFVPARLSQSEKDLVMDTAITAHKALDLGDYSIIDMVLAPRGAVVLEVDALPDLREESVLGKSLKAVGASPSEFFRHIVTLANV
ncbi:MAG: hypothetical protein A2749_02865 [Parcubacteria group bacterium RIFCSPHIGHO2_01_FULL_45_26]|nr:MAG: hypothetical protein A2749_02865 [Parcubacteria group bacterium RIFCSPHIGHO2_01_FULL_45_26]